MNSLELLNKLFGSFAASKSIFNHNDAGQWQTAYVLTDTAIKQLSGVTKACQDFIAKKSAGEVVEEESLELEVEKTLNSVLSTVDYVFLIDPWDRLVLHIKDLYNNPYPLQFISPTNLQYYINLIFGMSQRLSEYKEHCRAAALLPNTTNWLLWKKETMKTWNAQYFVWNLRYGPRYRQLDHLPSEIVAKISGWLNLRQRTNLRGLNYRIMRAVDVVPKTTASKVKLTIVKGELSLNILTEENRDNVSTRQMSSDHFLAHMMSTLNLLEGCKIFELFDVGQPVRTRNGRVVSPFKLVQTMHEAPLFPVTKFDCTIKEDVNLAILLMHKFKDNIRHIKFRNETGNRCHHHLMRYEKFYNAKYIHYEDNIHVKNAVESDREFFCELIAKWIERDAPIGSKALVIGHKADFAVLEPLFERRSVCQWFCTEFGSVWNYIVKKRIRTDNPAKHMMITESACYIRNARIRGTRSKRIKKRCEIIPASYQYSQSEVEAMGNHHFQRAADEIINYR